VGPALALRGAPPPNRAPNLASLLGPAAALRPATVSGGACKDRSSANRVYRYALCPLPEVVLGHGDAPAPSAPAGFPLLDRGGKNTPVFARRPDPNRSWRWKFELAPSMQFWGTSLRISAALVSAVLVLATSCSDGAKDDSKLGTALGDSGDVDDAASPDGEGGGREPDAASGPPPVDANAEAGLAPDQCALLHDSCPTGCTAIGGYRTDVLRSCHVADPHVACSRQTIFGDALTCRVRLSDGAIYFFAQYVLGPPYYVGWRGCTSAERQTAFDITAVCH
jgi:hypothetical protein